VKRGPWRKQYEHKQQGCEKRGEAWPKQYDPKQQFCEKGGGHDDNNMTLNNKVVKRGPWRKQYDLNNKVAKRGPWRKQYDPKQQSCEKGAMTKTIWP
jgi:hypothetical protein